MMFWFGNHIYLDFTKLIIFKESFASARVKMDVFDSFSVNPNIIHEFVGNNIVNCVFAISF